MLTGAETEAFLADGFVAVRGAVRADIAAQCCDQIWSELATRGVRRDDPSTWTEPVVRTDCPEGGPFAAAGTAPPPPVGQAILDGLAQAGLAPMNHGSLDRL